MGRHHAAGEPSSGPPTGSFAGASYRQRKPRRGAIFAALLVVVVLVAGGVVWKTVFDSSGPDCSTRTSIAIASDPAMTEPLKSLATDISSDTCYDYSVVAISGANIAGQLTRGDQAPDLWVADSTDRADSVTKRAGLPTDIVVKSIASSPVVVAGTDLPKVESWLQVMKLPGLRIGSPVESSVGSTPIVGSLSAVEKGTLTRKDLLDAMTILAVQQGNLRGADDSEDARVLAADQGTTPIVTTEQVLRSYVAAHPSSKLKAEVPPEGTTYLDYPMVVTASAAKRDAARTAAEVFAKRAAAASGIERLNAAGFRGPTSAPLPSGGVGQPPRLALKDADLETKTLRQWTVLGEPIRTLVVMDVSGSMNEKVGGKTRAELLVQAALTGNKLFPNNTALGMWFFSIDKGGPGQPWVEVAPIAREDSVRPDGRTQREFLNSQANGFERYIGGGTGLYNTTLAAFKKVQDTYDPNYSNSVIILTDGRDEDPASIGLNKLLAELKSLQDPARPIDIITIGISADVDADALQKIADAGRAGASFITKDPSEIPSVFVDAIQIRVAAAGR
ncbi:substrate-binding and VWA domain-containing protein [Williamsia sp. CHRR-6]|uniref:substrate-binding and VWA domain-containing protein n=1 Tax=Williamsia sp. CHRR-6 TaxID=2835871 RepID=UPI001BDAF4BC|nr:substrate-binding and VWA domain-containing protein [Williamsia sp. CHRR-6]MBT0566518.1 VWA domain-containing protein [Williamsia sp. CHRR-6]